MAKNVLTIKYSKNGKPIYYNKVGMQTNEKTYLKQLEAQKKIDERERLKAKKQKEKQAEKDREKYKKDLAAYEKENQRSAAEMAKAALDRKEAEKSEKGPKIDINIEALRKFRDSIDIEDHSLSKKYYEIIDKYTELIKVKETKVLAGKFLRLANKYDRLIKNLNDLYLLTNKSKIVTKQNENTFEGYVKRVDTLEKEYDVLEVEEIATQKSIQQKEKENAKKDAERQKKKDSKDKRITKKRNESDIKKAAIEKEKADEARKKETRQRRIQAVEEGRAKQAQEEENQRQELEEKTSKKREQLESRKAKSDKFFDLSYSPILHGAEKVGGLLGGAVNTLGLDFSDEKTLLSGLFSPVKAIGKMGLGAVKSYSEKKMGIDDNSINSLDEQSFLNSQANKKQSTVPKSQKILNNSKNKTQKSNSGLLNLKNKLKSVPSLFNSKNVSNVFNKNSSQNSNANSQNNTSQNANINPSSIDFNRTDDKEGLIDLKDTNDILSDILKELKKQTSEENKSNGILGSNNSRGSKVLGLVKSLGMPGAIGLGAAYLWEKFTKNENTSEVKNNVSEKSEKIVKKTGDFLYEEGKKEHLQFQKNHPTLAKIQNLLGGTVFDKDTNSNITSNKLVNSDTLNNSKSSNIRSVDSTLTNNINESIIKAEEKKIEKIRDDEKSNKNIADDMKKFLIEDFLNSFVEKFSNLFINSKGGGTGKSYMPPVQPF